MPSDLDLIQDASAAAWDHFMDIQWTVSNLGSVLPRSETSQALGVGFKAQLNDRFVIVIVYTDRCLRFIAGVGNDSLEEDLAWFPGLSIVDRVVNLLARVNAQATTTTP